MIRIFHHREVGRSPQSYLPFGLTQEDSRRELEGALFAAGALASEQGDYAAADALIRESLDIARQLRDKQGAAVYVKALAVNARDRGEVSIARSLFEESLVLWREWGDQKAVACCLSNLANIVKL